MNTVRRCLFFVFVEIICKSDRRRNVLTQQKIRFSHRLIIQIGKGPDDFCLGNQWLKLRTGEKHTTLFDARN
ncbi:hypothetical protein D9M71_682030 [compost metagenome]